MNRFDIFEDPVLLDLGPVPLTLTIITSFVVSLVLIVVTAFMRAAMVRRPSGRLATVTEMTYESIDHLVTDVVGRPVRWLVGGPGNTLIVGHGSFSL